ncbi:hypothetical protein HY632_04350 [Candidatus Uhrbacteria bacterium]|nr:hypothetical protein [Candidatus Uhrbacteria bacterium]
MPTEHTEPHAREITPEQRDRWARRGRETLETLPVPATLLPIIRATLDTPQFGPYHNEGLRMDAHFGAILEAVEQIADGTFDVDALGLPLDRCDAAKELFTKVVRDHRTAIAIYVYLHDLKKPDCMNVELADGSARIFTMEEWRALVAGAHGDDAQVRAALRERGITKIGYRHDAKLTGGIERDHGPEGVQYLEALGREHKDVADFLRERTLILAGIANHEMHFQAFPHSASAKLYQEKIASRFSEEEAHFILTVCFLDMAGSKSPDGSSEYVGLRNMLASRDAYRVIEDYHAQREATSRPLPKNTYGQLLNIDGMDAVRQKITHLEQPPKPTALTPAQLALVEQRLPDWLRDLDIPEAAHEAIRTALRSEHYARALNACEQPRLIAVIKQLLAASPHI